MIVFALLFLQLVLTAECTLSCWNKTCSCCRTGECLNSGNKKYCTDCIDGLTGDTCGEPCPQNCVNCSQIFFPSNRTCFSCKNGYYNGRAYDKLDQKVENDCSRSCKNGCAVCESYEICNKCKIHFYMDSTHACIECPKNCASCSSATNCSRCDDGYFKYSEGCEQCRPYCKRCDSYASCQECDHGYYKNSTGCEQCRPYCTRCDSYASCQECDKGFYLEEKLLYCKRCIEGNYTNKACVEALTEMQPDRQGSSTTDIGLIVGLVIGFIIVAICVCIIVFIFLRRRSANRRSFCCMSGDRNKTPATNDEEHVGLMKAQKTTGTRDFPSVEKITILQEIGTFSAIEEKYDDMKITVAGNKVVVEGYPLDIENAFKEIDNKCGDIKQVEYTHSKSREWLSFFQKKQTIEYVKKKLKQKHLHGIWAITGTELNVFVDGKDNSENFKASLLESVLEISEPVNKSLLSSEWWGEFLLDIRTKYQDKLNMFTKEQQAVVIICTDDVVKQVRTMVSEFLEGITDVIVLEPGLFEFVSNYWTQDDFVEIRTSGVKIKTEANRIMLRGLHENVAKCKEQLNMRLKDICSRQHVQKGTGIMSVLEAAKQSGTISVIETECRCVIKLPQEIDENPSVMLCDYGMIDSQLLEEKHQDSCSNTSTICFQTRRHNMKIQLIEGDIRKQKADIIVVGAASNLDFQSGSAFDSSLKQGGPKLKTDYNRRYPNGIQNGEVAVIDSGNFKCDKIYLTSLPPWKEASRNGGKVLRNFVRECLRLADKFDKISIAFSGMMSGVYLGYPMDIAVSIIYGAVAEFDSSYSKTSLREINIVEDDETIKTCIMCHLKKQTRETRTERIFIEDGTILTKLYDGTKYRMVKDGFAIGSIQLQVQIGDLINCTADAIVIEVDANFDSKGNVSREDVVVITDIAGLNAKHVIRVLFQDSLAGWRNKLVCCLEEADKKDIRSVALPVFRPETGTQTFSPDGIGSCLFAAIDDFTSQNPRSSVVDVRLMVPDSNAGCIPAIIAVLQARTAAINSQRGIGKIFKSQLGVLGPNNFKEFSVTVYSDAKINLDRCIDALTDRMRLEFAKKVVDVDMDVISSLNDEQMNSIMDSDIVVDVMFNKTTGQFAISGPLLTVRAAVTCLNNKIQQYKRKENNRKSAKVLYTQTMWHWQCEDRFVLGNEAPYDMMSNFIIETAYKAGKQTVELQSKDGKIYVIDFQKLVEYPSINIYDTLMVIRKDVLNLGLIQGVMISFSKSWTDMIYNEKVTRVALDDGEEYRKVEKRFQTEIRDFLYASKETNIRSVQVVKIERIQNRTLYQQYTAKKVRMTQEKSGCKRIKRELWHGTAKESIHRIVNNGFNRSYCGVNEISYGQGVYFAADASYFAQSNRAEYKPGAKRYMFLAKVLTGRLIEGHLSMRVLPAVNPAEPTVMYDSAVDDVGNPMLFVIFHDKQAYPKYLITYTSE